MWIGFLMENNCPIYGKEDCSCHCALGHYGHLDTTPRPRRSRHRGVGIFLPDVRVWCFYRNVWGRNRRRRLWKDCECWNGARNLWLPAVKWQPIFLALAARAQAPAVIQKINVDYLKGFQNCFRKIVEFLLKFFFCLLTLFLSYFK